MLLNKVELAELYRKRAERYDLAANLYYLLGFREYSYRKAAVQTLNLKPGDTVVEIGCGTGLNFSLLQAAVGPQGRIIGVDLTPEMLEKARERIDRNNWSNVELVQSDAANYQFPETVDGIPHPGFQAVGELALVADTVFCFYNPAVRGLTGPGRSASLGIHPPLFEPGAVSGRVFRPGIHLSRTNLIAGLASFPRSTKQLALTQGPPSCFP